MAMVKPGIAVRGRTREGASRRRPWSVPSPRALRGLIVPALLLVLWQFAVARGIYNRGQLPSPLDVVAAARELATDGLLLPNLLASLQRVFMGFALGGGVAVLLGLVVGGSRTAEALLGPTLQGVRAIPSLAWVPLLLLWLGFGELPKVVLVAIGVFFPVYGNLVVGIRQIDRKLVEVGRAYGLHGVHLAREVMLPAALPSLLTGLRLGLAQGWLFLVAAELLGAFTGLGFLLIDAENTGRVDIILLCIVLLALLGKLSDSLLHLLERRLLRWTDTFRGGT